MYNLISLIDFEKISIINSEIKKISILERSTIVIAIRITLWLSVLETQLNL